MSIISSILMALATPPDPVQLRCEFADFLNVVVVADEAKRAVTMILPATGWHETLPGKFSQKSIIFDHPVLTLTINRPSLAAKVKYRNDRRVMNGICKTERARKMVF